MNNQIVSVNGSVLVLCRVLYIPGMNGNRYMDGTVQAANGDQANFDFSGSHDCVVSGAELVFGDRKATRPIPGDYIFAKVVEVLNGYTVTAWIHSRDHELAEKELAEAGKSKVTPTFVPTKKVAQVPAIAITQDLKNNTRVDRRQMVKNEGELLSFEQHIAEVAAELKANAS